MGDNTIVFYSKFCENSKHLLHLLHSNNLLDKVTTYYCIDNVNNNGFRRDLPPFLKVVPSVITPDSPKPILEGKDAFIWINYLIKKFIKENDTVSACSIDDNFCSWDSDINKPNKLITDIIAEDDPNSLDTMFGGASITGVKDGDVTKPLQDSGGGINNSKRLEEIQKMRAAQDSMFNQNNPNNRK